MKSARIVVALFATLALGLTHAQAPAKENHKHKPGEQHSKSEKDHKHTTGEKHSKSEKDHKHKPGEKHSADEKRPGAQPK